MLAPANLYIAAGTALTVVIALTILHHHPSANSAQTNFNSHSNPIAQEHAAISPQGAELQSRRTPSFEGAGLQSRQTAPASNLTLTANGISSPLPRSAQDPSAQDLDALALAETLAPSRPAPPMPLTAQEKLIRSATRPGQPIQLAELDLARATRPSRPSRSPPDRKHRALRQEPTRPLRRVRRAPAHRHLSTDGILSLSFCTPNHQPFQLNLNERSFTQMTLTQSRRTGARSLMVLTLTLLPLTLASNAQTADAKNSETDCSKLSSHDIRLDCEATHAQTKTFYLQNVAGQNEANEIMVAARNMFDPGMKIYLVASQNALVVTTYPRTACQSRCPRPRPRPSSQNLPRHLHPHRARRRQNRQHRTLLHAARRRRAHHHEGRE